MVKKKRSKKSILFISIFIISSILLLLPYISTFSNFLSITTPGGTPTGVSGKVVVNGELVTSGKVDCRSGGISTSQSIGIIDSSGKINMVCLNGGVYEFWVDRGNGYEKFDTTYAVQGWGDIANINIIKGTCGNYCNAPPTPPACSNYYLSGSTNYPNGVKLGVTENGACPDRCVAVGKKYSRGYINNGSCFYRTETANFGLPSDRTECKICPSSSDVYTPPVPKVECLKDSDCGNYFNCVSQKCVKKTCPVCPSPTDYGSCIQGTKSKEYYTCDLSTNFQCKKVLEFAGCVPKLDCYSDSECNAGYICDNNKCIPKVECVTSSNCEDGFKCENSKCVVSFEPPKEIVVESTEEVELLPIETDMPSVQKATYLDYNLVGGFKVKYLLISTLILSGILWFVYRKK